MTIGQLIFEQRSSVKAEITNPWTFTLKSIWPESTEIFEWPLRIICKSWFDTGSGGFNVIFWRPNKSWEHSLERCGF